MHFFPLYKCSIDKNDGVKEKKKDSKTKVSGTLKVAGKVLNLI